MDFPRRGKNSYCAVDSNIYVQLTCIYIRQAGHVFRSLKRSTFAYFDIHMHLCVHSCERACVHICFVCVRVCTSALQIWYICMQTCTHVFVCDCVHMYFVYMCTCVCAYLYCVCECLCAYIYIYIYIFTRYHLHFLPLAQRLSKILKSLLIGILLSRLRSKLIFENFYVHRAKQQMQHIRLQRCNTL